MKKFSLLLFAVLLFSSVKTVKVSAFEKAPESNQAIIQTLEVDLTGDGKAESVILSGHKSEGSPFYENIKITVSDIKTGATLYSVTPTTNFGYSPTLTAGDFTGDGISELFYGATSGGSGGFGYFYLYSFNGKLRTLFDYERDFSPFKAKYVDYYKVKVFDDGKVFYIDISSKDMDYLQSIYNKGKLIEKKNADISAVNYVFPYFNSSTNAYSLAIFRRITGQFNADLLGYLVKAVDYSISVSVPSVYYCVAVQ